MDSIINLSYKDSLTPNKEIHGTLINSSAWEIAKITNAVYYLDFDVVNNLSKIYKLQAYYESIVKQYILKGAEAYQNETDKKHHLNTKKLILTMIYICINKCQLFSGRYNPWVDSYYWVQPR